jgi:chemotaxis protein MotB
MGIPSKLLPHAWARGDESLLQRPVILQGNSEDTGWLITLSDLTLLLLCFLAIWYVKQHQRDTTVQATRLAFETPNQSSTLTQSLRADGYAPDWHVLKDEIVGFITDAGLREGVDVEVATDEILISFKDAIPFASGKADLRPSALPVLEKVAAIAVSRPGMSLRVNGHTDDRPISTTEFPSNWELSGARASRVARYLIEKGVHPARIAVHGFAYHRPRAGNENQFGRGANRRVEISLMRTGDGNAARDPNILSR